MGARQLKRQKKNAQMKLLSVFACAFYIVFL